MSMSVLCLLTGQTARAVRDDFLALRDVVPRLLDEANSVAQRYIPDVRRLTRSGRRPITSHRSCRTTNSAARWKSTCW